MFIMVPQVRLRKRLNVDRATRAWLARTPDLVVKHWPATAKASRRT
jgi:hypothetical protein